MRFAQLPARPFAGFHPSDMRRLTLISLTAVACTTRVDQDPFNNTLTASDTGGSADDDATADEAGESSSSDDDSTNPTSITTDPSDGSEDGPADSSTGEPDVCGDGIKGPSESCDDMDFGDLSCESQGFMGGVLLCNANCHAFSTEDCFVCGDGTLQGSETCEGEVDPDVTCESEGFTTGTIACDPVSCQYDTSGCSLCGNDLIEGDEICDGTDVGGMDCASIGFEAGELGCLAACSYDYSSCSGGAYIQDFESGVLAPEFTFSGVQDWVIDGTNPIAGSFSAGSGDISDNQESGMLLSVTFAIAGTVEFSHEEDTESCCDYLQFYVDGVQQETWSGVNALQMESFPIAAGAHTLEWRYHKDVSISTTLDRVWIDDLTLTGGVPN